MKLKILVKVAAWGALALIAFVTLSPISMRPVSSAPVNIERLGAYLVLGVLFGAAYPKRIPLVLGLLVVGSVGLEVLQNLVPGRHGRVDDALFKAAGACLGALAGQCHRPYTRPAPYMNRRISVRPKPVMNTVPMAPSASGRMPFARSLPMSVSSPIAARAAASRKLVAVTMPE